MAQLKICANFVPDRWHPFICAFCRGRDVQHQINLDQVIRQDDGPRPDFTFISPRLTKACDQSVSPRISPRPTGRTQHNENGPFTQSNNSPRIPDVVPAQAPAIIESTLPHPESKKESPRINVGSPKMESPRIIEPKSDVKAPSPRLVVSDPKAPEEIPSLAKANSKRPGEYFQGVLSSPRTLEAQAAAQEAPATPKRKESLPKAEATKPLLPEISTTPVVPPESPKPVLPSPKPVLPESPRPLPESPKPVLPESPRPLPESPKPVLPESPRPVLLESPNPVLPAIPSIPVIPPSETPTKRSPRKTEPDVPTLRNSSELKIKKGTTDSPRSGSHDKRLDKSKSSRDKSSSDLHKKSTDSPRHGSSGKLDKTRSTRDKKTERNRSTKSESASETKSFEETHPDKTSPRGLLPKAIPSPREKAESSVSPRRPTEAPPPISIAIHNNSPHADSHHSIRDAAASNPTLPTLHLPSHHSPDDSSSYSDRGSESNSNASHLRHMLEHTHAQGIASDDSPPSQPQPKKKQERFTPRLEDDLDSLTSLDPQDWKLKSVILTPGITPTTESISNTEVAKYAQELGVACWDGNLAEVKRLMALPNFPTFANAHNKRGQVPLYCAAHQGHTDIVIELINSPYVDINGQCNHLGTSLHSASANKRAEIVALLIVGGADMTVKNNVGITPKQDARGADTIDIYQLVDTMGRQELVTKYPRVAEINRSWAKPTRPKTYAPGSVVPAKEGFIPKSISKMDGSSNADLKAAKEKAKKLKEEKKQKEEEAKLNRLLEPIKIEVKEVRDNVINEIVSTEQSYIRELLILNNVFKKQMTLKVQEEKIELNQMELLNLFGNCEQILNVNIKFLESLVATLSTWDSATSTISEVFDDKHLGPYLRMYKVYANTVNDSVAFLSGPAKQRPKLQAWFAEKMTDPDCKGLDFASYLTSPVKRIPRYLLLLGELKKHTLKVNPQHPELSHIAAAEITLHDIANAVNKSVQDKGKGEELAKLYLSLKHDNPKWEYELLTPLREYHKQYSCSQQVEKKKNAIKTKKITLYVFNNLILCVNKKNIIQWQMELVHTTISDQDPTGKGLVVTEKDPKTPASMYANLTMNCSEDKKALYTQLQENINNTKQHVKK